MSMATNLMHSIANATYQIQPVQLELDGMALSAPQQHYMAVHSGQRGTVLLWAPEQAQKHPKIESLASAQQVLAAVDGDQDVFMSVNEFYGWRTISQLKSLRACYVDIDAKLAHTGKPALLEDVLDALTAARMPAPSVVVQSGRGMHLYWLLENTPSRALPLWQLVENALIQVLKPFGADPCAKDCARVLRLVGTVNGKNGRLAHGQLLNGARWTLHALADEVLGARPAKPEPVRKGKATVRSLTVAKARRGHAIHAGASIYARWGLVFEDLVKIAESYPRGIPDGFRDKWIFLVAVALSWFAGPETIEAEVAYLARRWTVKSEAEALRMIQTAVRRAAAAANGETITYGGVEFDPRYRFKRETLWEWLEPIIETQPGLVDSLRAIVPSTVSKARKTARDSARWETHHATTETRQKALKMAAEGMSCREIEDALGVPRSTVNRWIKSAAENPADLA